MNHVFAKDGAYTNEIEGIEILKPRIRNVEKLCEVFRVTYECRKDVNIGLSQNCTRELYVKVR